jgi:hypothetical protein
MYRSLTQMIIRTLGGGAYLSLLYYLVQMLLLSTEIHDSHVNTTEEKQKKEEVRFLI